jgi:excisionase family DNA binding protein
MNITVDRMRSAVNHGVVLEAQLKEALVDSFFSLSPRERQIQFATTSRAAEIAGVSRRTIQLWIEVGAIQAVRVGKRYQVSLFSLRSYLTATTS